MTVIRAVFICEYINSICRWALKNSETGSVGFYLILQNKTKLNLGTLFCISLKTEMKKRFIILFYEKNEQFKENFILILKSFGKHSYKEVIFPKSCLIRFLQIIFNNLTLK